MTPLERALSEYGMAEIVGTGSNPDIEKYFKFVGASFKDDIPWCGAFMSWCQQIPKLSLLHARAWLNEGIPVVDPRPGDIVVLKRNESPAEGHVAFFCNQIGNLVYLLGGNQANAVTVIPYLADHVIGYRRILDAGQTVPKV
jgi:uncharacterized protein (TIGR02594 family)